MQLRIRATHQHHVMVDDGCYTNTEQKQQRYCINYRHPSPRGYLYPTLIYNQQQHNNFDDDDDEAIKPVVGVPYVSDFIEPPIVMPVKTGEGARYQP